ncbi:MAG: 3-hydroxybutyryl-CoA dehydrogenase [Clostridia bacterium]|nr:3-hydroxybutyryl-CoA dehydrogenase [Clostridia bacterium]
MKNIFVIGTGTMGLDIAQVFSTFGYNVHMFGRTPESTGRALAKLTKGLNKRVERGKMEREKADAIINGITFTNSYDDAKDADLVIEAIIENVDLKKILFRTLENICPETTIFATNTSSISITEIASATNRPDKFIGMHFFNPATVMKLVELIRGMHTSDETFAAIRDLTVAIGKDPVEVAEAPGFVVNRLLIPMINEACEIVQNGIASPADVDKAMQLGCNHPMGPLALGDLIGLDVCLAIMDTLYNETGDSKYRASCLLRKMVRAGKLGRKTGKGFFEY